MKKMFPLLFLVSLEVFADEQPQNLGIRFLDYWNQVKTLKINDSDLSTHVKLYKRIVIKNKDQFYLDVVFDKRDKGQNLEEVLRNAIEESLPLWRKHEKAIETNINNFEKNVSTQSKRLKELLPDFKMNFPIYGMVSLNKFAGGVRLHGGKQVLAISMDKVAFLDRDFDMVFSHEAFHVYHKQVNPNLESNIRTSSDLLILGSFIEGLATYAEGEFNPEKRHRRMVKKLVEWCDAGKYRSVLGEFLSDNKMVSIDKYEETKHLYRKWFYTKRSKVYNFPSEGAYCIGDRLVTTLSEGHSLKEMALWPTSKIIEKSKRVLVDLLSKKAK